jgi:hypothetical protein
MTTVGSIGKGKLSKISNGCPEGPFEPLFRALAKILSPMRATRCQAPENYIKSRPRPTLRELNEAVGEGALS